MNLNKCLMWCIEYNNLFLFEKLLDMGADINHVDDDYHTPLTACAAFNRYDMVKLLLKKKANVDFTEDADYWTPLMWASYRGCLEIVKLLLLNGANVHKADTNCHKAIFIAKRAKQEEIVSLLLKYEI